MDLSQCRLCLSQSKCFLNILIEKIDDKTIASILSQHFWFVVKEDDPNKVICQDCWIKVENFHLFYTKVYNVHSELLSKVEQGIKLEIDDSPKTGEIELLLDGKQNSDVKTKCHANIAKFPIRDNLLVFLSDLDDDDKWSNSSSNKADNLNDSKNETTSDDESVSLPKKRRASNQNSGKTRKTVKEKTIAKKDTDSANQLKVKQQNQQISEYFAMDCELCSLKLDSFRNLQAHYRMEHKIKGYVRCCSRKYVRRAYILEHLGRHLNPEKFKCDKCDKSFAAKRCLQLHLRSHIPTEERLYKCTECPKTYVIANVLKRHLETHATERKFVCGECGKSYITEYQLKSHQRNMHSDANIHICDVCAKPFRSKDIFEKHHKTVHGKVPLAKIQCKICNAWLTNKFCLKRHNVLHAENKMSFACNICGRSAPNSTALQSHMRTVHTDKMYECNLCNKTFKRALNLKEHLASHTGDTLYSCPYCTKTFNSSANMYTHRKKSHVKEWKEQKLEKLKGSAIT